MTQRSFQRSKKRFKRAEGARRNIFRTERSAADHFINKGEELVAAHTKTAWRWVVRKVKPKRRR